MNIVLEMLKESGLDILTAEIGYTCQLRLLSKYISQLKNNEYIIILELLNEFTQILITDSSGPISVNRITSIKNYPSAEDKDQIKNDIKNKDKKSSDDSDQYMKLSELDIKVLVKETRREINSVFKKNHIKGKVSVYLIGKNSEHPNLTNLIGKALSMPTYLISPANANGVDNCDFDPNLISEKSIGRLVGLGLGLMRDNEFNAKDNSINQLDIIEKYNALIKTKKSPR